jgi:acetylglutamate kinase
MKHKLKIVKIGGNVINDEVRLSSFLDDFAAVQGHKLLVHGGGRRATDLASSLGLQTKMVDGRRITDEEGLEVVTMVYAGLLNKKIVAGLQAVECNALGMSGADGNSIMAHKRTGSEIDYGFAGDIDRVDASMIASLLHAGLTPVFCAITHDCRGQLLNTNADTIASELARALCDDFEVELTYCFEKEGVLEDLENETSVIEHLNLEKFHEMKNKGLISEGMLPKLENSFDALKNGVTRVIIGQPELLMDADRKHTELTL